jgi:prophage tail gpP-like protein
MCDSWRDTANNLWAPNHTAPVDIPAVKVPNVSWVIGTVTYLKDERGRHANVLLMPANAFLPEPVSNIGAFPTAEGAGLSENNPAAGGGGADDPQIVSP